RGVMGQVPCYANGCNDNERPSLTVRTSLVTDNYDAAILMIGGDLEIDGVVARATQPNAASMQFGRGISAESCSSFTRCATTVPSKATVTGTLIEDNRDIGLFISGSDATIDTTVVRNTTARASDGDFGDGVSVFGFPDAAGSARLTNVSIDASDRAGLSTFGS